MYVYPAWWCGIKAGAAEGVDLVTFKEANTATLPEKVEFAIVEYEVGSGWTSHEVACPFLLSLAGPSCLRAIPQPAATAASAT